MRVCTHFSNRYRVHAALRSSQSTSVTRRQPPSSSPLCPYEPGSGSWHRPPCSSGSPVDHAFLANREKLPSSCTSSPKCSFRSRRWQCFFPLRCRLHSCSANIQRRKVSSSTTIPSSSAKCSAAKVGPNRVSSEPEYFFLIKCKTRRRNFNGLP